MKGSERGRPRSPPLTSHLSPLTLLSGSRHGHSSDGPPGRGEGDPGRLLAERLGLPKFATGDLLRDAVKRGTPLGGKAKAVMEAGHLVSDDIILGVVREELARRRRPTG